MGDSLLTQGVEIIKRAVAADREGEYEKALGLYRAALKLVASFLRDEQNPSRKQVVKDLCEGHMSRCEEISAYLKRRNRGSDGA